MQKNITNTKIKKSQIPDLISNRYVTASFNHVWFVDFTLIGHFWAFVIIEGSTRRIMAFDIKKVSSEHTNCSFTAADCINVYKKMFEVCRKPEIIHSDNGGQFLSNKMITFLKQEQVKQSKNNIKYVEFGNQVIERYFRTLKERTGDKQPGFEKIRNKTTFKKLLSDVIEEYNNSKHSACFGLTPINMESALQLYNPNNALIPVEMSKDIMAKKKSDIGDKVQRIKAEVVTLYAGDWISFFFNWQREQTLEITNAIRKETNIITEAIYRESDRIILENKREIHDLQEINSTLLRKITFLENAELAKATALKLKQEERLKRQMRTKLPARDRASFSTLTDSIEIVKTLEGMTDYRKARHILSFFILYATGLRIGNILLMQVRHLHQILLDAEFDLVLIKKRKKEVKNFPITEKLHSLYKHELYPYAELLMQGKSDDSFVFSSQQDDQKAISRELATKEINAILHIISKATHKKVTTHSFRIGLTTTLIKVVGISAAAQVIGHKDIRTTEMYNRSVISPTDLYNAFTNAHNFMAKESVDRKKASDRAKLSAEIKKKAKKDSKKPKENSFKDN
jgi:integrase/recombinase XerD